MKIIAACLVVIALFAFICGFVSVAAHAQSAKVIALSPADAKEAKDLYAQRDAINKRIDDLHQKVTDKYLSDEKPGPGPSLTGYITTTCAMILSINGVQPPCPPETADAKKAREDREAKEKLMHHLEVKDDWRNGFEFSDDFKFVVPKSISMPSNPSWYGHLIEN